MRNMNKFIYIVSISLLLHSCGESDDSKASNGTQEKSVVSASTTEGGQIEGFTDSCSGACEYSYDKGTEMVLGAVANSGFQFSHWEGDCLHSNTDQCLLSISGDSTIFAIFTKSPTVIDNEPPHINIIFPSRDLFQFEQRETDIRALITDNTAVNSVSWICTQGCVGNGNAALDNPEENQWSITDIALTEGINEIELNAVDISNNYASATLRLTRQSQSIHTGFKPPIGIPDPGGNNPKTGESYNWGDHHPILTEAPNVEWEEQNTFYVHFQNGDDANGEGTPDKPRRTIPETVTSGAYVELHGDLIDNSSQAIRWECTQTQPCWLRGLSNNKPTIKGSIVIDSSAYVFIENIHFNSGTGGAVSLTGNSHHVVFRHSAITNRAQPILSNGRFGNAAGISLKPGLGETMEHIIIYKNDFDKLGEYNYVGDLDPDFHAIVPSLWNRNSQTKLRNLWFLNNNCFSISGDCVQVNAGNWPNAKDHLHHIYIGKNTVGPGRQAGFGIKQSSDVIISQNRVFGSNGAGAGNAGGGIGYQYSKSNLWILFNELHDNNYGIRQSDTSSTDSINEHVYIIGNLIYDIRPSPNANYEPTHAWSQGYGIALWHGNLNRHIIDNTIYGVKGGVIGIYNGVIDMSGNIIADIGEEHGNVFFNMSHPGRTNNVKLDHHLFYNDNHEEYFSWQNAANYMDNLTEVKQKTNYCQKECLFDDPLFVNPTLDPNTRDFHLRNNSPAKGANIKHSAYDHFQQQYGLDIYVDFDGQARDPLAPSLGAFE